MSILRVSCPACVADRQVDARAVVLRYCTDTGEYAYVFRCPTCGARVAKPCSTRIAELLAGSVRLVEWRMPAELAEAHTGPAFSPNDAIDAFVFVNSPAFDIAVAALTETEKGQR